MTDNQQDWKVLSFRDNEEVPTASLGERTRHIRQRAVEKFGLNVSEINAEHTPGYPGVLSLRNIENGGIDTLHVFELQVSPAAAARLSAMYNPDILLVSDLVEPQSRGFGARDPRELRKGPKI
jgi:hypothetical protein